MIKGGGALSAPRAKRGIAPCKIYNPINIPSVCKMKVKVKNVKNDIIRKSKAKLIRRSDRRTLTNVE